MVKGISRQVIVVHSPDKKLFEQAIFILRDEALGEGITEEKLLKEAEQAIRSPVPAKGRAAPLWAAAGAAGTGLVWLLTALL